MGAGDLLGAQHALGRLHHRPHRHGRGGAPAAVEQRHDVRDLGGAFDLGHQDGIGARRGDGGDVGLAPGRAEPVAADGDLALAVGLALGGQRRRCRAPLPWRRAPRHPRGRRSARRPAGCAPSPARACWRPAYRGRCGADGRSSTWLKGSPKNAADYNERASLWQGGRGHALSLASEPCCLRLCRQSGSNFSLATIGPRGLGGKHGRILQPYRLWRLARTHGACRSGRRDRGQGIEALGLLSRCDALLTGYVGDAALGDVVLDTARRVRAANARAIWCCDPVLGDIDTGIYVKPGIDAFFRERAIPAADLVTPNHFELEHLTGRTVSTHGRGTRRGAQPAERPQARADHQPAPRRCRRPIRSRWWR